MRRTIDQPADGYVPLRVPEGWILLRLVRDQDGTLLDTVPAVRPDRLPHIWPKRTGRKDACRASFGLKVEEELAQHRAALAEKDAVIQRLTQALENTQAQTHAQQRIPVSVPVAASM